MPNLVHFFSLEEPCKRFGSLSYASQGILSLSLWWSFLFCLAFVLRHEAEGFSNELWVFDFSYKEVKWVVGLFTGFVFIISEDFIQLPVP